MGVKGLWDLLRPAAYSVNGLDVLTGKIVAVDISIWLHQFMLGMGMDDDDLFGTSRDANNASQPISRVVYLRSLFKRICKLLYYDIKPVFVFDGSTPLVKHLTIQRRRMKSSKQSLRLKKAAKKLLNRVMEQSASGTLSAQRRLENMKKPKKQEEEEDFDFSIPEEKKQEHPILADLRNYEEFENVEEMEETQQTGSASSSSAVETPLSIPTDIDPEVFVSLPPEVQQEIMTQLKSSKRYKPESHIKRLKKKTPEKFSSSQLDSFIKGSAASIQLRNLMRISQQQDIVQSMPQEIVDATHGITSDNTNSSQIVKEEQVEEEDCGFFTEDTYPSQPTLAPNIVDSSQQSSQEGAYQILAGGRLASNPNQGFVLLEKTPPKSARKEKVVLPEVERTIVTQENAKKFGEFLSGSSSISQEAFSKPQPSASQPTTAQSIDIVNLIGNDEDEDIEITFSESELANLKDEDMLPDSIFSETIANVDEDDDTHIRNINDEWEEQGGTVDDEFEEVQPVTVDDDDEWDEVEPEDEVQVISDNEEMVSEERAATEQRKSQANDKIIGFQSADDSFSSLDDSFNSFSSELNNFNANKDDAPRVSEEELALQDINAARFEQNLYGSDYPMIDLSNSHSRSATLFASLVENAKQLLTHFGIPFLDSPSEADAQCGFLCQKKLVDAVITEDSDLFLFGANCVYRNVFGSTNKHANKRGIEEYNMANIEKVLGFKRWHLIQLALLLGSDYTDGIHQVGPVIATQVVDAFNAHDVDPKLDDADKIVEGLNEFKAWVNDDTYNLGKTEKSWGYKGDFQINYKGSKKKFLFPDSFPDKKIIEAYVKPSVDDSLDHFEWADIDTKTPTVGSSSQASSSTDTSQNITLNWEAFYRFCAERLAWSKEDVDQFLKPVLDERKRRHALKDKKLEDMTPLERFIFEADKKKRKAAQIESKRVLNAVGSIKIKQAKKRKNK